MRFLSSSRHGQHSTMVELFWELIAFLGCFRGSVTEEVRYAEVGGALGNIEKSLTNEEGYKPV
jgi:hypothetical protein